MMYNKKKKKKMHLYFIRMNDYISHLNRLDVHILSNVVVFLFLLYGLNFTCVDYLLCMSLLINYKPT